MMREDFLLSDRRAAAERKAVHRHERDRDYHHDRATFERKAADRTQDSAARTIHLQLAELHDAAAQAAPLMADRTA